MKSKIHKYLINLGTGISALLAFSPIVAFISYKYTEYWWIYLIISILYDIYWYDNMEKREYINKQVKLIEETKKGKGLCKTEEDKLISYKYICENISKEFKEN